MDDVIKRRRIEMEELQQRARKVPRPCPCALPSRAFTDLRGMSQVTRTLRVYVYSVHHSQKDTSAEYLLQDLTHEAPSSWTLRVEGRVLDADVRVLHRSSSGIPCAHSSRFVQGAPQRRFTSFFRRLVVLLDPAPHASSGIVEVGSGVVSRATWRPAPYLPLAPLHDVVGWGVFLLCSGPGMRAGATRTALR